MKFVFDFGGVVFRWQPARLLRRALPRRATDEASAALWVRRFFQDCDWANFDRGSLTQAALVPRIAQRTGLAAAEVQRVVDAVPDELQPKPDSVDLLRRLHGAGHSLYYLSNMPAPMADILESRHDFFSCFSDGVFSSRVGLAKPDPAIYALAARRFGASAHQLVFMDDHAPNVLAAQGAGWNALHFSDAAAAEAELRRQGWLGETP